MGQINTLRKQVLTTANRNGLVIVSDVYDLLDLSDLGDGIRLVLYHTPLAFRRDYEALRYSDERVVIHVKTENAFIPDVEARVGTPNQIITVTPRSVLCDATKDDACPPSVNDFGRLVIDYLDSIVEQHSLFRSQAKTGFSDQDAARVVLSGVVGISLFGNPDPAGIWSFMFSQEPALSNLNKHHRLSQEFASVVKSLPEPLNDLLEGDRESIVTAVWIARILAQHLNDPLPILPNLSPSFFASQGWDKDFVVNLADRIAAMDAALAVSQVHDAEQALTATAVLTVANRLSLSDPAKAIQAVLSEHLSPMLSEIALRHLLSEIPTKPNLLSSKNLSSLVKEARTAVDGVDTRFTNFISIRPKLRDLLRLLVDLVDLMVIVRDCRSHVDALNVEAGSTQTPRPFVDVYCDSYLYRIDLLASRILRLVKDIGKSSWVGDDVAATLQHRTSERIQDTVREARDMMRRLNQAFAQVVANHYADWVKNGTDIKTVASFIPQVVSPHSYGKPSAWILIFDGMRWDAWMEYVLPELARRYTVEYNPTLAILPTSTGYSRRSLFSGRFPDEFKQNDPEGDLLAAAWTDGPSSFQTTSDESAEIALRMHGSNAEVVVFRFTDDILHNFNRDFGYLYEHHVRNIVERDVRQLLDDIPKDAIVFVASDHGFIELGESSVSIPPDCTFDPSKADDIKWRYALLTETFDTGASTVSFEPLTLRLPSGESYYSKEHAVSVSKSYKQVIIATDTAYLRRKGKGGVAPRLSHGGASLQEMVVPSAVLVPKIQDANSKVEILSIKGLDSEWLDSEVGEIKVVLQLSGPVSTETVSIDFAPTGIAKSQTVTLVSGESKEIVLPLTFALPENKSEHTYLIKLNVRSASKSKTKMPGPRPCKLRITKSTTSVERETSSVLDNMFKKR